MLKQNFEMAVFTEDEVSEHSTKDDLWLIIHGGVYDVTKYLTEHPGGELVLLQSAGTDATDEFEDNGHSDDARELMAKYKIGDLKVDEKIKPSCGCCLSAKWLKISIIVGSLAVVAAAVAYRKLK